MDKSMDNGVDITSASKGRHMCAYMPPDGTLLYEYMDGVKLTNKQIMVPHNTLTVDEIINQFPNPVLTKVHTEPTCEYI
jgi:hypothetical protein